MRRARCGGGWYPASPALARDSSLFRDELKRRCRDFAQGAGREAIEQLFHIRFTQMLARCQLRNRRHSHWRGRNRREAESQYILLTETQNILQSDFYSYRYFASEGFLPGYNFPRLPLSAWRRIRAPTPAPLVPLASSRCPASGPSSIKS